jgi:hypothetical protein
MHSLLIILNDGNWFEGNLFMGMTKGILYFSQKYIKIAAND